MKADHRLQSFLYLLARDHLPFGTIEKVIMTVEEGEDRIPVFSEPNLGAWAKNCAERLTEEDQ